MVFVCKKCKKCFCKDVKEFEEVDEYCFYCDNYFVFDVFIFKVVIIVEVDDVWVDVRMFKDDRVVVKKERLIVFDFDVDVDKLG